MENLNYDLEGARCIISLQNSIKEILKEIETLKINYKQEIQFLRKELFEIRRDVKQCIGN